MEQSPRVGLNTETKDPAPPLKIKKGSLIYFVGIAGTAMSGLAGVLKSKGFKIQGSDQNIYPPMSTQLKQMKIPVMEGYNAARINENIELAVLGNAISQNNIEAQAIIKKKIPYMSLPEFIGSFLIQDKQSLVVSGTHGKTTTSSLLAWAAEASGFKPDFLIGGIPNNFENSFRSEDSSLFVIEGDEYDTAFFDKRPKFVHYRPSSAVLTSIEMDHVDIYDSLDKIKESFGMLIKSLPDGGVLAAQAEDPHIQSLLPQASSKKIITYGMGKGDFKIKDRQLISHGQRVTAQVFNGKSFQFELGVFGLHNALNALGVLALAEGLHWDREKVLKGLRSFKGVRRRLQVLAEFKEALLIEDFAHHPTAARAAISALREKYPGYKIAVVFEPRSASSRRKVFQELYAQSFSKADFVFTAPPYQAEEIKKEERFSSEKLTEDLRKKGVFSECHGSVSDLALALVEKVKAPVVIVVMSNGPFGGVHQKIKEQMAKRFS